MSRARLSIVAILIVLACPLPAAADTPHHPVNFSLWYPISSNQNRDISTNFRINLIYGRVGEVRGLDLNGVVSLITRDMRGIQLTGVYSHVTGDVRGATLTGGINFARGDVRGIQLAGLVNYNRGTVGGLQYATFFNYVEESVRGIQFTTALNIVNDDAKAIQLSSVANMVGGSLKGVQVAGINLVNDDVRGGQLGVTNIATTVRGVQVGLANFAREAHGVQIGFLNMVRYQHAIPIGVINVDQEEGDWAWDNFGSNLVAFSTGVRTTVRGFHSILAAGVGDIEDGRTNTVSFSWHYGYLFGLGDKWRLGPDVGFVHLIPDESEGGGAGGSKEPHYAIQGRVVAQWNTHERFKIFAAGGLSYIASEYSSDASTKTEPLGVLGISLF